MRTAAYPARWLSSLHKETLSVTPPPLLPLWAPIKACDHIFPRPDSRSLGTWAGVCLWGGKSGWFQSFIYNNRKKIKQRNILSCNSHLRVFLSNLSQSAAYLNSLGSREDYENDIQGFLCPTAEKIQVVVNFLCLHSLLSEHSRMASRESG